jgi:hypothetical protein
MQLNNYEYQGICEPGRIEQDMASNFFLKPKTMANAFHTYRVTPFAVQCLCFPKLLPNAIPEQ